MASNAAFKIVTLMLKEKKMVFSSELNLDRLNDMRNSYALVHIFQFPQHLKLYYRNTLYPK